MKTHVVVTRGLTCLVLALAVAMAAPAAAQQGEKPMTPEQKAQMDAWMKAMTPGKQHQDLAAKVGTWEGSVSMWEAPGQAPQVSQARAERTMGLGGRVMLDHWTGTMMGMPFEGLGMTGYDNVTGKYWTTWSDNFGTGVMTSNGTCDPDPKKGCSYGGSYIDPITGKDTKNRSQVSWPSADQERMEMFMAGPDGKEWKSMEIVVHRVKK
jgi:hypothetical protein